VKAVIRKSLAHKTPAFLLGAAVLLVAVFPAGAIFDAALQMQLGNPSGATTHANNHYQHEA
jgi:hypothetical protein